MDRYGRVETVDSRARGSFAYDQRVDGRLALKRLNN